MKIQYLNSQIRMKKMFTLIKTFLIISIVSITSGQPENEQIDQQTYYIQQFAKTMSDFIPTETFTFDLSVGEQQNLAIWPNPDIQKIRGVFYIDSSLDPDAVDGEGFFVGCQVNGQLQKNFVNQRLGVFNLNLTVKPINIKLIFKSDSRPLTIYVSYQLKKSKVTPKQVQNVDQSVPTKQQQQAREQKSKLQQIGQKFSKVQTSIQSQQNSLRMVLKHIHRHGRRLEGNLKYGHYRIIIETLIVVLSGLFGMWILKKQMNHGYQLLV